MTDVAERWSKSPDARAAFIASLEFGVNPLVGYAELQALSCTCIEAHDPNCKTHGRDAS